jgi:hypothetical protein
MIKNIKIHKIIDIIDILKNLEPNKCIHLKLSTKIFI